jgi:YVTN family beta-propeller protein
MVQYMSMNKLAGFVAALSISAGPAFAAPKNIILFVGDGVGVSSLNAAGIYGYGKPQALYLQKMPHVALVDTSTTKEWVSDAAASATAWATGYKGRNGVISQSSAVERGVKDGETLKTIFEYAEEHGLSTGLISNDDRTGVTIAIVAAFYAHSNNRQLSGDIFMQLLNPKFGNGPDVVIGTGRKWITDAVSKMGHNLAQEIPAKGYAYLDSLAAVSQLDPAKDRVISLFDDPEFDFNQAVEQAIARLSKNPKGYLLVAFSDCHLGKGAKTLNRIVALDKAVRNATEKHKKDTLILMTADHGYDIRIKGETLVETAVGATSQQIAAIASVEDQHTAEEVPLIADGPGSEMVHGFMSNTDVFHVMMAGFGWEKYKIEARYSLPGAGTWDYLTVDSPSRRLFVSHETQVEVLNADNGKILGAIPDTPGVHGIAIAGKSNRGFTSNGREDTVTMFDSENLKVIQKISVGKGPDGIYFDPASNRVFTNNHGSHDITAIDASTGTVAGTVRIEGDGEQAVSGADGSIYVNLEDKGEVAVFDPRTLQVTKRFPIAGASTPTGLAMDTRNNRLFVACRSQVLLVMDAANGKIVAKLPIGASVDAAAFDPESRLIFASNGDGTLNIFHQKSADSYEDLGSIRTRANAKTMAFDPKTKKIYLSSGDIETIRPADASQKPQRKVMPGTFEVLVAGQQ